MHSPKSNNSIIEKHSYSTPSFKQKNKDESQQLFSANCFQTEQNVESKVFYTQTQMKQQKIFVPLQHDVQFLSQKSQKEKHLLQQLKNCIKKQRQNIFLSSYKKYDQNSNNFLTKNQKKEGFKFVQKNHIKIQKYKNEQNTKCLQKFLLRPFRCNFYKCTKRFTSEEDLHLHKRKHVQSLIDDIQSD